MARKYKVSWDEVLMPEHIIRQGTKKEERRPAVSNVRQFEVTYYDDSDKGDRAFSAMGYGLRERGFTGVKVVKVTDLEVEL